MKFVIAPICYIGAMHEDGITVRVYWYEGYYHAEVNHRNEKYTWDTCLSKMQLERNYGEVFDLECLNFEPSLN